MVLVVFGFCRIYRKTHTTAAGVNPGTLFAWPIEEGLNLLNNSTDSFDKPPIFENTVSAGISKASSLLIAAMSAS